ncbi:MAG: acetate kinase, partial [Caldilineales bacterium]|nr:acetate kinase [Caldilineales bacterium]
EEASQIRHRARGQETAETLTLRDHHQGLEQVTRLLLDGRSGVIGSPDEIEAIGHRVVHGGERFSQPTIIDDEVRATIRALFPLAPLHNPPNLAGIEVATDLFPRAIQVAVFDTAFHQTMPPHAFRYAIPSRFYEEHGVRAYGFHGTSHLYVSKQAITHLGKAAAETNLITAHLGNGCSITAVQGGRSVDTSMGFSPLPGLIMGTRSGDIDPAVVFFLAQTLGLSLPEIDRILNKQSGLLGVGGHNDLRALQRLCAQGDEAANLAMDMYTYRIKKYIGAYMAALGRVDALVFTAGVGENSAFVRERACAGLEVLGIQLDPNLNAMGAAGAVTEIQAAASRVRVLIVPTNEELEIADQTLKLLRN